MVTTVGTAPEAAGKRSFRRAKVRSAGAGAGGSGTRHGVRSDIQGMRAIAVGSVLVYHLSPTLLPGGYIGVDVFFVISGFLITTHLLSVRPRGMRAIAEFWVRRVRRLMPAAILVLATTLVAFRVVGPDARWLHAALETIASALNVENWALTIRAVDYLAAGSMPSPVQHYWSLSVEEQFYAFWPLLIAAVLLGARRFHRSDRAAVLGSFAAVVAGSLLLSAFATRTEPAAAFFSTPVRVWELGAGALLAAFHFDRRTRAGAEPKRARLARVAGAWCGLALIMGAALCFDDSTRFPGTAALVPVLGAVCLLAANDTVSITGRALAIRPIRYLGDISYSLYLWHWPVLILWSYAVSQTLTLVDKAAVAATAVVLAALTKHCVEDRFRADRRRGPVRGAVWKPLVGAGLAISMIVGLCAVQIAEVHRREALDKARIVTALADPCFGAGAVSHAAACPVPDDRHPIPSTLGAFDDRPDGFATGCIVSPPYPMRACVYGDRDAKVSIALVGNSHAFQWLPTLQALAGEYHWKVTTFAATGCPATSVPHSLLPAIRAQQCLDWGRQVQKATQGGAFDLVVTSELTSGPSIGRTTAPEKPEFLAEQETGFETYLRAWVAGGTRVLVLRDTPFPRTTGVSVPECLGTHRGPEDCGGPRRVWVRPDPLFDAAQRVGSAMVTTADLTDTMCGDTSCAAVVGGAVVFFDGSHMTATFAKTLGPVVMVHIHKALAAASTPTP